MGTLFLVLIGFVYFIPTICAYSGTRHSKRESILIVNLFLGWTFIGWVIALAWALSESDKLYD